MSSRMNLKDAREIAKKMTFREAVYNCLCAKCVPFRKATKIKINELLEIANSIDKADKCHWIHYDYRTICPKEHDSSNPYWRIPENMDNLKYCPYCGKEIEIDD